jgi:ABC-2 type transport system ATP-binding protein
MQILADDIVIIAAGQLVRQGPVNEVVDSMAAGSRVRVRTPDAEKLVGALSGATVESGTDGVLHFSGVDAPQVGAAALHAGVVLHELVSERPDLERVFLELTQGKADIR